MSQNYKLLICYDGTRYYGWEHQPNRDTIQGKLEAVLTRLNGGEFVDVIGAGRTDAGVHAKGMVANAVLSTSLSETELRDYMNQYLPEDIAVREVKIAAERFHARYKAVGKTYRYTCFYGPVKPVFNRRYVTCIDFIPNTDNMKKAAAFLEGKHDYASFCGNPKMKKSTVRVVDSIEIEAKNGYLYLTFHGTGFLQNMVRIMTGTLLQVGKGERRPEEMTEILEGCNRQLAGPTAPPCGLCLEKVDY